MGKSGEKTLQERFKVAMLSAHRTGELQKVAEKLATEVQRRIFRILSEIFHGFWSGDLEHGFYFPYMGHHPIWLSYLSRGVGQPPTSDGFGGISRLFYDDFMGMYWNLLVIIGSLW